MISSTALLTRGSYSYHGRVGEVNVCIVLLHPEESAGGYEVGGNMKISKVAVYSPLTSTYLHIKCILP